MSDASKVKRFYFIPTGEKDFFGRPTFVCDNKPLNGDVWFIPVEDHDRVVNELHNRLYEYNKETSELKAEVAHQAREIEVLTEKVSFMSLDSLRKYAVVKAMKDNSNDLDKAAESLKVSRKRLTVELLAYNLYPATLEKEGVKDDTNN